MMTFLKKQFIQLLSVTVIAIGAIYFTWFEPPYLSYENLPFPTTAIVYPGEDARLLVKRCSTAKEERSYNLTRTLVRVDDHSMRQIRGPDSSILPGCTTITSDTNTIPLDTPSGRYYLTGIATIPTTYTQRYVRWTSQVFVVAPKLTLLDSPFEKH